LANATWIFITFDDLYLDDGRFLHPKHTIIVEVRLLNAPIFEGDFAPEQSRDTEDDATLHLRCHNVWIDDDACIDDDHDAINADISRLCHGNFRHLRHERAKGLLERDTAPTPLAEAERFAPS